MPNDRTGGLFGGDDPRAAHALSQLGAASLEDLLPLVYDDVPSRIHRMAARSLTAHLDKLTLEGTVRTSGDKFRLVESAAAR